MGLDPGLGQGESRELHGGQLKEKQVGSMIGSINKSHNSMTLLDK